MSDRLIGEVRIFAGENPPSGWAICDGRLLRIADFPALFGVIGTMYGGDGNETFAIPNISGRVVLHAGFAPGSVSRQLGETGGTAQVKLNQDHLPIHDHSVAVPDDRTRIGLATRGGPAVGDTGTLTSNDTSGGGLMSAAVLGSAGDSQAHNNLQPYIALNYMIAITGSMPEPD